MNEPGIMSQEKMELDLEIPSSLVQSDGHLRRSNSAPMINGLRLEYLTGIHMLLEHYKCFTNCLL